MEKIKSLTSDPIEWDKEPCPYCGGKVIYTSNSYIYHGKTYGNGMCYVCTDCFASVGVHGTKHGKYWDKNEPSRNALGILATGDMKHAKMRDHDLFDSYWREKKNKGARKEAYQRLANEMNIPVEQCHFGWFNLDDLNRAYDILIQWN